jgi:hypothetical protein
VGFGHRQQQHQQQRQPLQQQQQQRPQAGGSSVVARPPTSGRTAPRQRHGSVQARALAATGIVPLGYDFLTFLTATVLVVPSCKFLKISPVLGFLAAGLALEQAGCVCCVVWRFGRDLCSSVAASSRGCWHARRTWQAVSARPRPNTMQPHPKHTRSHPVVLPTLLLACCRMLKDLTDMETLSELGVLFLLYEQGLELSFDRLKVRVTMCVVACLRACVCGCTLASVRQGHRPRAACLQRACLPWQPCRASSACRACTPCC